MISYFKGNKTKLDRMKGVFLCLIFITLFCSAGIEVVSYNTLSTKGEPALTTQEAFNTMMEVVMSPRCMNCHPSGDKPTQGDDMHLHFYNVQRGPQDHGAGTFQCQTCHQDKNNSYTGVPGARDWHLAPRSMGWQGLNKYEIAGIMLDPGKNGGLDLDGLVKHLTEDDLVMWAFEPGVNQSGVQRTVPPVPKEEYIQAVKEWASGGALIPDPE